MSKNENYPLFDKWYKTLDWILDKCEKYPKSVRFTLSSRITNISLDIIEGIIDAIYVKNRLNILKKLNRYMERLRILFRISADRKYLSLKQYKFISEKINESGKMIGGWIKSCNE